MARSIILLFSICDQQGGTQTLGSRGLRDRKSKRWYSVQTSGLDCWPTVCRAQLPEFEDLRAGPRWFSGRGRLSKMYYRSGTD